MTLRLMAALHAGLCLVSSSYESHTELSLECCWNVIRVQPVLGVVQEHAELAACVLDSVQQTGVRALGLGGASVICIVKEPSLSTLMRLFANLT